MANGNGKINDFLVSYLGASWKVSLLGYAAAILMSLETMMEEGQAVPTDSTGWMKLGVALLLGLMGRQAKDKTVSNAQNPVPAKEVDITGKGKAVVVDRNNP